MTRSSRKISSSLILISMLALLGGCATDCGWVQPINPSRQDVLSRGTKQQILTHNETWEATAK